MTSETESRIIESVIRGINSDRIGAGYRPMSTRGQDLLRATTANILANLNIFAESQGLDPGFRQSFIREVQSYFRDEWYTVDTQIEYLQRLRDKTLESIVITDHDALHNVLNYFDSLTLMVVEACRRPARYEWPLLLVVGYGNLARTKLVGPLKDLLPNSPFDLWIADKRPDALADAAQEFAAFAQVRVLDADVAVKEFPLHPAATKIVYVATDAASHFAVVKRYTELGADVIAIEKPLCSSAGDVKAFRKLDKTTTQKTKHVVVDHYALRRAALIVEGVQKHAPELFSRILRDAERMTFRMMETQPLDTSRGAVQEGVILDMLPHVFPFISALVTADISALSVKTADTWVYDGAPPTAGETCAYVVFKPNKGPNIDAIVGKGLAENRKEVIIEGKGFMTLLDLAHGKVTITQGPIPVELGASSRDLGYGFVIHSLLNSAALEFQGLRMGIEVAELLLSIRATSKSRGSYALGTYPF